MRKFLLLCLLAGCISPVLGGAVNSLDIQSDIQTDGAYIAGMMVDTRSATIESPTTLGAEMGTAYRDRTLINNGRGNQNQITHDFELFEPVKAGEVVTVRSEYVHDVDAAGMIHDTGTSVYSDGYFPMNNTSLEEYAPWNPTYNHVQAVMEKTFMVSQLEGVDTSYSLNGGRNSEIPWNEDYDAPLQIQQSYIGTGQSTGLSGTRYSVNTMFGTSTVHGLAELEEASMRGSAEFTGNFTANRTESYAEIFRPNDQLPAMRKLCPLVGVME